VCEFYRASDSNAPLTVFFLPLSGSSIVATAIANRPIEVDSRRNRANRRPPKFLFKIKSANF
jgi:hypothetical protein